MERPEQSLTIVCVPISDDRGLSSPVSSGLDSAPLLLLVEPSTLAFRAVPNAPQRRTLRGCDPCAALDDTHVDVLLVSSIGPEALARVLGRGVQVLAGATGTAADALAAFMAGRLPAASPPSLPAAIGVSPRRG